MVDGGQGEPCQSTAPIDELSLYKKELSPGAAFAGALPFFFTLVGKEFGMGSVIAVVFGCLMILGGAHSYFSDNG